jgi:hypothetical protein
LSTFISLAIKADVELSLANSNFPSNITLALDHSKNAVKLMGDAYYSDDEIIDDIDFVRKYNEALNRQNATTQAMSLQTLSTKSCCNYYYYHLWYIRRMYHKI